MVNCKRCGLCCKTVSVAIDDPEKKADWDELKWMLHHENINIYLDSDNDWCVEFITPCRQQKEDQSCAIYEERPDLCRNHDSEACETNGEGDICKVIFKSPEDVDDYLKKNNIEFS